MKLPKTLNGTKPLLLVSALQKCIRRGLEREAMEMASELIASSKAYCSMACNRLEVCLHEDIDTLAQPELVAFVHTSLEAARRHWGKDKTGKTRMMVGNVIRAMCRAQKSREGCHFAAATAIHRDGQLPTIPDWAYDVHTQEGKRKGRGLDHFLKEGAKLGVGRTPKVDPYKKDAIARWRKIYKS